MDVEVPVLAGNLIIPTQTGFSLNRISKKKSTNQKHCLLFKASQHGIERLEICDKDDLKNPKIVTLENCVKITQEPAPLNLIHVVTKTGTLTLNALNEDDLKRWVAALQTVAFKEKGSTLPRNSVIEEDNDLYCTSYSDGIFTIRLLASDISVKCHLEARSYLLHLTATELQLKNFEEHLTGVIAKWPYRYIRKYGYRDGKFTFEAGRKCETGEGVFSLEHSNPQEIFRCMSAKMKSMKKLISGDSMANLDCGEHQFNAALSMEAGSRSPLPPSPNHHSHSESDLNQSGHLIRGFLSSNDSLNNVSMSSSSIPLIKHTPHKPPRKSISGNSTSTTTSLDTDRHKQYNKYSSYDTVNLGKNSNETMKSPTNVTIKSPSTIDSNSINKSITLGIPSNESTDGETPPQLPIRNESKNCEDRDYECIETITNAWKTRGIDDIKHTEHVVTPEDDLIDFVWQRSQSQKELPAERKLLSPFKLLETTDISSAITTTSTTTTLLTTKPKHPDDNYDRLEFFPTKSKPHSSDYKTVVTITTPVYKKQTSQPITSNDYEIIGGADIQHHQIFNSIQSSRLADDSYLGYGALRKPTTIATATNSTNQSPNQQLSPTSPPPIDDDLLNHRKFNGLDYAIVSKPKRV